MTKSSEAEEKVYAAYGVDGYKLIQPMSGDPLWKLKLWDDLIGEGASELLMWQNAAESLPAQAEQELEPALKLLADVMHLWIDGYICKASNSAAPAATSSDVFDEVERFLATRNISVDYCGWNVTRDSSSISTEPVWAILYDDPERPYQVFTGQDAELAATAFYEKEQARWTCHLMRNAAKGQSNGQQ